MNQLEKISLASGNSCELLEIKKNMIPDYYLLIFPKSQGEPTAHEVTEMLRLGIDYAKQISYKLLGDEEAFTVLYSGYSSRREKGWHVHIILLGNRWKKAWLYMILCFKNISQALGLRKDDAPRSR